MAIRSEASAQASEKIFGSVTIVPPAADRTTRLFNVEIEIKNVDQGKGDWMLKPGMIASANVYVKDDPALAIPADAAVRLADGNVWGYFVRDGYEAGLSLGEVGQHAIHVPSPVVEKVMLPITETRMDSYLVTGVPKWCTRLVVEGQNRLQDGQPVIVLSQVTDNDDSQQSAQVQP